MRILTFGWDFPPIKNGGLGVACFGLTQELVRSGMDVVLVLPRFQEVEGGFRCVFADVEPAALYEIDSPLRPYQSSNSYIEVFDQHGKRLRFGASKIDEVRRYAQAARHIATKEHFDLIHAHDWSSYLAGVEAKKVSGRPLILHVHATSFDQAGGEHADPAVYDIERQAFHHADKVVTVSHRTRQEVINRYAVPAEKVEVVYNGIEPKEHIEAATELNELREQGKKVVLYLGRITIQKGVDYFVQAARKVVDVDPNVIFIISGWGDMERQIMQMVGGMGLSQHVFFTGAIWDEDKEKMYRSADLVVMPSVSEPFGIVPLESIEQGTPVLISKQSGVSEVLSHALKVDFWDVDEMANKILAALRYGTMSQQLVDEGRKEVSGLTWRRAAQTVIALYHKILAWFTSKG